MIGENKININQATMQEAIKIYLEHIMDSEVAESIEIYSVKHEECQDEEAQSFEIILKSSREPL